MENKEKIAWNFWVGLTLFSLSVLGIILVPFQVLEPKLGMRSIAFSPSTFPYVSLSIIALISILIVIQSFLKKPTDGFAVAIDATKLRVLIPMGIFLFYVVFIEIIGMFLSTLIAVALIALALGNRNWLTILIISSITSTLISTQGKMQNIRDEKVENGKNVF